MYLNEHTHPLINMGGKEAEHTHPLIYIGVKEAEDPVVKQE